jgi:hypothetical protein
METNGQLQAPAALPAGERTQNWRWLISFSSTDIKFISLGVIQFIFYIFQLPIVRLGFNCRHVRWNFSLNYHSPKYSNGYCSSHMLPLCKFLAAVRGCIKTHASVFTADCVNEDVILSPCSTKQSFTLGLPYMSRVTTKNKNDVGTHAFVISGTLPIRRNLH